MRSAGFDTNDGACAWFTEMGGVVLDSGSQ